MSKAVQRKLRRYYRSPECTLSRGEKVVLMTLAYFGGDDGMGCAPGKKKLAQYTDYSERQIIRIFHKLEAKELIATSSTRGGRGHATNYAITYGKQQEELLEEDIPDDAFSAPLPDVPEEYLFPDTDLEVQLRKTTKVLAGLETQKHFLVYDNKPIPAYLSYLIDFGNERVDELEAQLASVPQLGAERAQ